MNGKNLFLKYRKGTGKDVSTIWRWSGRINKIGLPHPSVLCCVTLLKYLLQQRYRDVIGYLLNYLLQ